MTEKIKYTEEDREILSDMLEELLARGESSMTCLYSHMDWDLPGDNKVIIKRYRIHIGKEDG